MSASIRTAIDLVDRLYPIVTALAGVDADIDLALHPVFEQEGFRRCLDDVRRYATLVCCKYVLAQPVIVAVVEADELTPAQAVALAKRFDKTVLEMRQHTGKIAHTRLSVTGIVFFLFFDPAATARFDLYRKNCKIWHFFRKTWVVPWMVDVPAQRLIRHDGLPILIRQIIDSDRLTADIFHTERRAPSSAVS